MAEDTTGAVDVTDADLDRLYEEGEGKTEEVVTTEEVVEEKAKPTLEEEEKARLAKEWQDNYAKTNEGRKLKKLEDNLSKLADIVQSLASSKAAGATDKEIKDELADLADDEVITVAQARKLFAPVKEMAKEIDEFRQTKEQAKVKAQYESNYISTIVALKEDEEFADVIDALDPLIFNVEDLTYNKNFSGGKDPSRDATRNFMNAVNALRSGKVKKNPFKGEKPAGPTGGPGGGNGPQKTIEKVKLDADTLAYIQAGGASESEVQELLGK